jgi:alpha-mannosidase
MLLLGEDVPGHWDNWDIDRDQRYKMAARAKLLSRNVVANGPLQLRIRSVYKIGAQSTLMQDVVFHAGTPKVDFETVIDWTEKRTLMKVAFPLNIWAEQARHEIQYGHVLRPTHTNLIEDRARFEVCAHKWTDMSDDGFGAALLNDSKYGVSVEGGEIALSLMKSGVHPDPRGDEGRHFVTYSLLPHSGPFSVADVVRPAYELNIAPVIAQVSDRDGELPSLLTLDTPNVIVEAVKWAEEGNAFVVRLYEAGHASTKATVTLNAPVMAVEETNLLEDERTRLDLDENRVTLDFRPFEIKTLRCLL